MSRTVLILEATLETLRRDGWIQRAGRANGRCLVFAVGQAAMAITEDGWCMPTVARSASTPGYEETLALLQSLVGVTWLIQWNDAPERIFADIEALLTAAIAIATEQDQPKEVATH